MKDLCDDFENGNLDDVEGQENNFDEGFNPSITTLATALGFAEMLTQDKVSDLDEVSFTDYIGDAPDEDDKVEKISLRDREQEPGTMELPLFEQFVQYRLLNKKH